jgi:hypothetical protein
MFYFKEYVLNFGAGIVMRHTMTKKMLM